MRKLSLFNEVSQVERILGNLVVPEHTVEALDDYFIRGYRPGNFITCILTNNLYGAVASADFKNRHAIYEIVILLTNTSKVPSGSYGDIQAINNWINDFDKVRTTFSTKLEKEYIWKTLTE
jgi:hypothetical protein